MFHLFLALCYIHVGSVLCCSTGDEPEADGQGRLGPVDGGAWGRQTGVLQVGARWDMLVLSCSSRLPCVTRVESWRERGEGQGKDQRTQKTGTERTCGQDEGGQAACDTRMGRSRATVGRRLRLRAHADGSNFKLHLIRFRAYMYSRSYLWDGDWFFVATLINEIKLYIWLMTMKGSPGTLRAVKIHISSVLNYRQF